MADTGPAPAPILFALRLATVPPPGGALFTLLRILVYHSVRKPESSCRKLPFRTLS